MKKLLLCLTLLCSTAQAQYQNGNNIYQDLIGTSVTQQMFALGYVIGVVDTYIGVELCVPKDVTQGQLMDVVTNFLGNRPQIRHQPADILVLVALGQHWPCKEKKKSRKDNT
jgi:hypothetical protein